MMRGLVSIIMPTFNRAGVMGEAINSVLSQKYDNFELIIVDDGSKDNTKEVVEGFRDERIIYHAYKENQGGNHARNVGLKMAKGEYISFLDTDNKWEPNFLNKQVDMLIKTNADISVCRVAIHDNNYKGKVEKVPAENHRIFNKEGIIDSYELKRSMLGGNLIDTNVVCIKRRCIEENKGFNENIRRLQDWEYFLRMLVSSEYRVSFVPEVMVHSFLQKDSVRFKHDFIATFLYIFEKWMPLYEAHGLVNEQCERIIRLSFDKDRRIARQDALTGLMRLLPLKVIEKSVMKLGLKKYNIEKARKIKSVSINLGLCKSVISMARDRRLVVYVDKVKLPTILNQLPSWFLENINNIVCSDDKCIGEMYLGIPIGGVGTLENYKDKVLVLVAGEDNNIKNYLYSLGYVEGVEYIDIQSWL